MDDRSTIMSQNEPAFRDTFVERGLPAVSLVVAGEIVAAWMLQRELTALFPLAIGAAAAHIATSSHTLPRRGGFEARRKVLYTLKASISAAVISYRTIVKA